VNNNRDGDDPLPDVCMHQTPAHKCPICNPPQSAAESGPEHSRGTSHSDPGHAAGDDTLG
jgi:hypothetical protein